MSIRQESRVAGEVAYCLSEGFVGIGEVVRLLEGESVVFPTGAMVDVSLADRGDGTWVIQVGEVAVHLRPDRGVDPLEWKQVVAPEDDEQIRVALHRCRILSVQKPPQRT